MVHKILADIVVLTHFIWILFLFIGTCWGLKNRGLFLSAESMDGSILEKEPDSKRKIRIEGRE